MPLVEHLIELRRRLLISFAAIVVCGIVVFIFYNPVLNFLSGPYQEVTRNTQGCGRSGCKLIVTDPLAPFIVRLKIAGYGGLALVGADRHVGDLAVRRARPAQQRAALRGRLRRVARSCCSCSAAWSPGSRSRRRSSFLLGVGGSSLRPLIDANKYLTLVMLMFAAFGFAFEFPLLLVFLMLVGVVNTRQLRNIRRWAAVGITTFAAIITPSQDPFSLLFMAVPMYIFYEVAILVGRMMKR